MAETKLDLHEFDGILDKYTFKVPNALQGVTFTVFDKDGECTVTLTDTCHIRKGNLPTRIMLILALQQARLYTLMVTAIDL